MTTHEDHDAIDSRLRRALNAVARAEEDQGASSEVKARLLATVRAQRTAGHRRRQTTWLAAAAAIVVMVTGARWALSPDAGEPAPTQTPTAESAAADVAGFLPLRYAQVPTRGGQIVRMTVPATALASFGLEPSSAGSDVVTADVFVGDDGLARAIRFTAFSPEERVQ